MSMIHRRPRPTLRRLFVMFLGFATPLVADPDTAQSPVASAAGTIVVDGACTLSEAILSANLDMAVGGCTTGQGVDTIVLDVETTLTTRDTVNSTFIGGSWAGLPDVTSAIVIQAGAESGIRRDAILGCGPSIAEDSKFRLLNVLDGGDLTLDGLTLENGCAVDGGGVFWESGSDGSIEACHFIGNRARGEDGMVAQAAHGGAVVEAAGANLTSIRDSFFTNNSATGGSSSASGARPARGGALYLAGENVSDTEIINSYFNGNTALGGDGASGNGADGLGGAAFLLAPTVGEGLLFFSNTARGGDGLNGTGGSGRGGAIHGVLNELLRAAFINNQAAGGTGDTGGTAVGGATALEPFVIFHQVSFEDNVSFGGLGDSQGGSAFAGAHWSEVNTFRGETFENVTFANNTAQGGMASTGTGGNAVGGAIVASSDRYRLFKATVANNEAVAGSGTVADGTAMGGGVQFSTSKSSLVRSSILHDNRTVDAKRVETASDCQTSSTISSIGTNFVGAPGNCTFAEPTDRIGVDPGILPVMSNGCAVPLPSGNCPSAFPLEIGSPAVDAGECAGFFSSFLDVRGFSRPWNDPSVPNEIDGCDSGSYELRYVDEVFTDGFESGNVSAWTSQVP